MCSFAGQSCHLTSSCSEDQAFVTKLVLMQQTHAEVAIVSRRQSSTLEKQLLGACLMVKSSANVALVVLFGTILQHDAGIRCGPWLFMKLMSRKRHTIVTIHRAFSRFCNIACTRLAAAPSTVITVVVMTHVMINLTSPASTLEWSACSSSVSQCGLTLPQHSFLTGPLPRQMRCRCTPRPAPQQR